MSTSHGRGRAPRASSPIEVGPELRGGNLPRRRPEGFCCGEGGRALSADELRLEEAGLASCQQKRSQNRAERVDLSLDSTPHAGGNPPGDRVGLLCRDTPLLDRKRRRVAGRVDV